MNDSTSVNSTMSRVVACCRLPPWAKTPRNSRPMKYPGSGQTHPGSREVEQRTSDLHIMQRFHSTRTPISTSWMRSPASAASASISLSMARPFYWKWKTSFARPEKGPEAALAVGDGKAGIKVGSRVQDLSALSGGRRACPSCRHSGSGCR